MGRSSCWLCTEPVAGRRRGRWVIRVGICVAVFAPSNLCGGTFMARMGALGGNWKWQAYPLSPRHVLPYRNNQPHIHIPDNFKFSLLRVRFFRAVKRGKRTLWEWNRELKFFKLELVKIQYVYYQQTIIESNTTGCSLFAPVFALWHWLLFRII